MKLRHRLRGRLYPSVLELVPIAGLSSDGSELRRQRRTTHLKPTTLCGNRCAGAPRHSRRKGEGARIDIGVEIAPASATQRRASGGHLQPLTLDVREPRVASLALPAVPLPHDPTARGSPASSPSPPVPQIDGPSARLPLATNWEGHQMDHAILLIVRFSQTAGPSSDGHPQVPFAIVLGDPGM